MPRPSQLKDALLQTDYRPAVFVQLLAVGWLLVLLYGSLYPFIGWKMPDAPQWSYLFAPWPRYYLVGELLLNVLAYLPAGALAMAVLTSHGGYAFCTVFSLCVLLSFSIESAQQFLPMRVASNVDLACNTLGAFLGTLAGRRWRGCFDVNSKLQKWRQENILRGILGDFGIVLMLAWLLAQCLPEAIPFTSATLALLAFLPPIEGFGAGAFLIPHSWQIIPGVLIAGLFLRRLLPHVRFGLALAGLFFALLIKSASSFLLIGHAPSALASSLLSMIYGAFLLLALWRLPAMLQYAVCIVCLLALIVMAHLSAPDPHWNYGNVWRFAGFLGTRKILQALAVLWPFMALIWLGALAFASPQRLTTRLHSSSLN